MSAEEDFAMTTSSTRPSRPSFTTDDRVRVHREAREIAGEPFWLDDLQRWRVLTNCPDRFQQFVDCDDLRPNSQLALF